MQTYGDLKVVVEGAVSTTLRARKLSCMFDAPPEKKCRIEYDLDLSGLNDPWSVGLIVGPSGSGKSTVMRELWGESPELVWKGAGVVDDFDASIKTEEIAAICQAVGFNTIPAWMRPYGVLSNGEKFRADLARRLLEGGDLVVVDEFTSVVDRQVAKIGSHAVQKYIRRTEKKFVAVTCHYDVVDWLQPDWILDMATCQLTRRLLQRRPSLNVAIGRLPRTAWSLFAPFHYMNANLPSAAKCFGLWVEGRLACFAAVMFRPTAHHKKQPVYGVSRVVTLPDYQGLGLAFVLLEVLGAEYRAAGNNLNMYPASPTLVRSFSRSTNWSMTKAPGLTNNSSVRGSRTSTISLGGRQNATFRYVGPIAASCVLI